MSKLNELRYELVNYLPYSADLLIPKVEKMGDRKEFYLYEEVIVATDYYLADLETSYFTDGLKRLEHRYSVKWLLLQ